MEKKFLVAEINRLRNEKKALIMAHYYQDKDIQDIADFIGDSLALAQHASKTDADIIVMCGVHFMAETAKIISPDKKVLIPDANTGCSLADSCQAAALAAFKQAHPQHKVISYVNTSAAVKALTDVVVTSSNAVKIVESFPKDEELIFGPDHNLGNYINGLTGRRMLLWDGACHVHARFSAEKLKALKDRYPAAKVLCHPECPQEIVDLSDYTGATSGIIAYAQKSDDKQFIIVTEAGVLVELQKLCPDKEFIPAPPTTDAPLNLCESMHLNTLEKLYLCLRDETPEVTVDAEVAKAAAKSIQRMLELSAPAKEHKPAKTALPRLVFATHNLYKTEEVSAILKNKVEIVNLGELGCNEEIPETADTLVGNALQKARYVYQKYGTDCFADDTGLEVEALGGAPGVFTARFAGEGCTFEQNVDKILRVMKGIENRKARFRTVIALIMDGKEYLFEGEVRGEITTERKGKKGFGYDPVFRPEGSELTFAEMGPEEKNNISHRGRAVRAFADFLLKR